MTTITALNLTTILENVNFLAMPNYALQTEGLNLKDNFIYSVLCNLGRTLKTNIIDIGMAEIEYTLKYLGLQQCSESTIRRSMKKLLSNKLIARFRNGRGDCNSYIFPAPENLNLPTEATVMIEREQRVCLTNAPMTVALPVIETVVESLQEISNDVSSSNDNFVPLGFPASVIEIKTVFDRPMYPDPSLEELALLRSKLPVPPKADCPECNGIGFCYAHWPSTSMIQCECVPLISPLETKIPEDNNSVVKQLPETNLTRNTPSREDTNNRLQIEASEVGSNIELKSRYSLEICRGFAYSEANIRGTILKPEKFAESIYLSGKQDKQIGNWLRNKSRLGVGGN